MKVADLTIDNTKVASDLTDFVVYVDLADMPSSFWSSIRPNTNTHALDLESSSSQYVSISNAAQSGLGITGNMTIECDIKFESLPSSGNTMRLVQKYNPTGNQRGYSMFIENVAGTYYLCFDYSDNGTTVRNHGRAAFPFVTGVKYHLAISFTASTTQVINYVNGVAIGTNTGAGTSIFSNTSDFIIGQIAGGSYVDGIIDDVRVWNTVRTAAEISSNMFRELVGNESGLVGYWKFNNDYLDETSNNNDLTASGSPSFTTDVAFSTAGGDIRIFKSDGTTELARDLVSCDISGETGELHFKYSGTLSGSVDTTVEIHADGSSRDYAFNETYGRNAVWSNYVSVYHLKDLFDSKGVNNLTNVNSTPFATGKIGNGADFNGSSQRMTVGAGIASAYAQLTLLAWVKTDATGNYRRIMSKTDNTTFNQMLRMTNGNKFAGHISTASESSITGATTISSGTWYRVALTYDGSNIRLYVNGASDATAVAKTGSLKTSSEIFGIGAEVKSGAEFWDGLIDEAVVLSSALSADWLTTDYNNQNSPSTFYSVSEPTSQKSNFLMYM